VQVLQVRLAPQFCLHQLYNLSSIVAVAGKGASRPRGDPEWGCRHAKPADSIRQSQRLARATFFG